MKARVVFGRRVLARHSLVVAWGATGLFSSLASAIGLIDASRRGDESAVVQLLDQRTDPNAGTPTGETALHAAACNDHMEIAARLIEAGAKIIPNRFGISPLVQRASTGARR